MRILSRLKLRTKLTLLLMLSALALVASIAVASTLMRQRMMDDRIDKLHALSLTARGFAESLEHQVQAGRLTRAQAMDALREHLHQVRYGGPNDYFLAQTDNGLVVMHGGDPAREGKPTTAKDDQGRSSAELARDVLRNADGGVITYAVARPGHSEKLPKLSYVTRFEPWQLNLITGAWTDDIETASNAALMQLLTLGGAILAVTLLVTWLINRDISGSLNRLKAAMEALAQQNLSVAIPGADRRDEVGQMTRPVLVFREHMIREQDLSAAREMERQHSEAEKHAALVGMAETIEVQTAEALRQVGARTGAMAATADEMHLSAARTGVAAGRASGAAEQALANARNVSAAADQLASSIRAIGDQVDLSTSLVGEAVEAGVETRATIAALNEQVGRIGSVADMIREIAAKTNLLALNATIEAARAGDSGKGFAVVASEVKALATRTARATDEIARHIAEVRGATGVSVTAVARIEQTIDKVSTISGSIAEAVAQQGAATAEIARNVSQTAAAADEMANRIGEVSAEATRTDRHSGAVRDNAAALSAAVAELQQSLIQVVHASIAEADHYTGRMTHIA